ncbi:RAMP4 family protein [Eubacterium sp. 1001713B170207_170306_E7]|uniref:RAMP4 family protein n=1 Tax=Eubacterium sp. 1001713B170207_170306_E7 TaxID=2787097 RepID=UPI0018983C9E|nr:RAMP4 family protein [Eubacterium sp. 1001713B170207_170306_E7]
MENMQNSWVISDTMNLDTASASESLGRTATRKATHRKAKNTAKASGRKPRSRAKAKELTALSYLVIAAVLIFVVCIGLLFQQSMISELNEEVRTMQAELEDKQAVNDSKNGQIMASTEDLSGIEATARGYGMTTPTASQYVYETTMENTQRASADTQGDSWLRSIFK